MLKQEKLTEILTDYKKVFASKEWPQERYKWVAVKWFQVHWDVNAEDFPSMLHVSLDKTSNLLSSKNNLPRGMIEEFAQTAPEVVRAMFINLYDERQDLRERIIAFKAKADELLEKYGHGAVNHFQRAHAISTYLWLRYPEKYYMFKYSAYRAVADILDSDYKFKKGAYADNIMNGNRFFDEICEAVKQDQELVSIYRGVLSDAYYLDPEYKTLTQDLGIYICRHYAKDVEPDDEDYDPGISTEQWVSLLKNPEVFTASSLQIMKRLKDYGGEASCKQLSVKYGESIDFYRNGSVSLARRVAEKTNCKLYQEEDKVRYWPVLYTGKDTEDDEDGTFLWKLRKELSSALDQVDLSNVSLYPDSSKNYWWLNANPKIWSFTDLGVGEVQAYTLYNENHNKRRVFQNFLDAKAGDMVIGYESYPVKQIVALGRISAEQDGTQLYFEKVEGLGNPVDYKDLKDCPELSKMEYFRNPQGSLFRLSKGEFDFIMDMIREQNPLQENKKSDAYGKEDFLKEVYISEQGYNALVGKVKEKSNVILQGAPGVGKTFCARKLAYSMMGEKDDSRIEFIQFHQNYSYEDFMMGYKPSEDGFELKYGIFYQFCQKAANNPDKEYFFIIDEINRGNMSKIFGELLMLIEKQYRGKKITLAYNGMQFSVPKNLYIIGMMNTADRSLAMIDYALRRRFGFFKMFPAFDSDGFRAYQKSMNNETFDELIEKIKQLNAEIEKDRSLGKGFCIGHSYFCNQETCTEEWMRSVVDYDIIPMLEEYWFDDDSKVQHWSAILHGVFQ
ncbi:MAG: AAA family ATPase [Bulleidia sp.]|nr:AAA family ATPase [Bulleidia sp.]